MVKDKDRDKDEAKEKARAEVVELKKSVARFRGLLEASRRAASDPKKDKAALFNSVLRKLTTLGFNWGAFKADPEHTLKDLFIE